MTRADIVTVDIERNLHQKLVKNAESSGTSLRKYVNELLLMNLEKDEFLSKYAPFLHKIGIQDNALYIKDSKNNKLVEIRLKNGKLQSNDDDPIYLQYAMALPELSRLKS